jgi:putative DNA primase/helicase
MPEDSSLLSSTVIPHIGEPYFEDGKFISSRLGESLKYRYEFLTTKDNETVFVYNPELGIFTPEGEALIKEVVANTLQQDYKTHYANETINWIKYTTFIDRNQLGAPKNVIVLENGVLDIETMTLSPHSSDYKAIIRMPVTYDPNVRCPNISKFISEVAKPEDIDKLFEFIGYCLYREYPLHHMFILVGEGRNGKSTFLRLLQKFLGNEYVSNVSLQDLIYNRFKGAELYQKLANIYADLPKQPIVDAGTIKLLCGEDRLTVEKKHKNPFSFENYAKMIFSCNEIPESYDTSYAFYHRCIVVEFPNKFEGVKADKNLLSKLTIKDEMSGLLNLALSNLKNLLKNGEFTNVQSHDERMQSYVKRSSPVHWFVITKIRIAIGNIVPKDEVYQAYVDMCRNELDVTPLPQNSFTMQFKRYAPASDKVTKIDGKSVRVWTDIDLKEDGYVQQTTII